MKLFSAQHLDALISEIDAAGGPAASGFWEQWAHMQYQPTSQNVLDLDPYSPAYTAHMLAIYKELAGDGEYTAATDEMLEFDLEAHVLPFSAYGNIAPRQIALHHERLARAIRHANLPSGASVLDMGCGWGLSSEFLAQCGFKVTAVDINPRFVELVARRAKRLGYPITTVLSSFQEFRSDVRFDAVLFYECLHHEKQPWTLLTKLDGLLTSRGKILLAGEPIQDFYWKHWGLRLDVLSVYCIRKFGWFESGWSLTFLKDMLARAGFLTAAYASEDPEVGLVICAERPNRPLGARDLEQFTNSTEWYREGEYLTSKGSATLNLSLPPSLRNLSLIIHNFRGRPISFHARTGEIVLFVGSLSPGENVVQINISPGMQELELIGETWLPAIELGTPDMREISFHLSGIKFESP